MRFCILLSWKHFTLLSCFQSTKFVKLTCRVVQNKLYEPVLFPIWVDDKFLCSSWLHGVIHKPHSSLFKTGHCKVEENCSSSLCIVKKFQSQALHQTLSVANRLWWWFWIGREKPKFGARVYCKMLFPGCLLFIGVPRLFETHNNLWCLRQTTSHKMRYGSPSLRQLYNRQNPSLSGPCMEENSSSCRNVIWLSWLTCKI